MLKLQRKDKHVESIFAARLDEGSIPSSSTSKRRSLPGRLFLFLSSLKGFPGKGLIPTNAFPFLKGFPSPEGKLSRSLAKGCLASMDRIHAGQMILLLWKSLPYKDFNTWILQDQPFHQGLVLGISLNEFITNKGNLKITLFLFTFFIFSSILFIVSLRLF